MGSAVLVTYERHHHKRNLKRDKSMTFNTAMKTEQTIAKGYPLDGVPLELPLPIDKTPECDRKQSHVNTQSSFGTSTNAPSDTVSEDSCSSKRKLMNVNDANYGNKPCSVAAMYDFSGVNLTTPEKRDMRIRLKEQLDVILHLIGKLEAREMELGGSHLEIPQESQVDTHVSLMGKASTVPDVVDYNYADAMLSVGGKGKRVPKVNQLYVNPEFVSGNDKLPFLEKQELKPASGLKRNAQEKLDDRDSKRRKIYSTYRKKLAEIKRQCKTLLKNLMSHKHGWIFNEPVDAVKLHLHDYFTIIKKPMDLGTIKTKLDGNSYCSLLEFAEDVRLTFDNAVLYNPKGHFVHNAADILKKMFESRWKSLEGKVKELDSMIYLLEDSFTMTVQVEAVHPTLQTVLDFNKNIQNPTASIEKLNKTFSNTQTQPELLSHCTMTLKEKCDLSRNIESLPNDKLEQVLHLIKSRYPNLKQTDEEIEVDINSFDTETLWELQRVVDSCKKGQIYQKVQQVGQIELHKLQPSSGGFTECLPKPLSRDGNQDEAILGCVEVPVVNGVSIDEDVTSDGKCMGSSRHCDGDAETRTDANHMHTADSDKVPPEKPLQEPVGSVAVCDQRSSSFLELDTAKLIAAGTGSVASAFEGNISSKVALPGGGVCQEGSNIEGNVPPEKLLRTALLKSRFADTILKAKQKTLPLKKSDKSDPDKLKKEREDLERQQREERARLQEEAELAQRRVEAESAAKARRRREEEREAARLALQKMEKTVEIDENSQILKDLEMLGTIQPEHNQTPSSGADATPVHTQDEMPSFTLQGGNPLEQLGLFMKVDDEEEDEHEKGSIP